MVAFFYSIFLYNKIKLVKKSASEGKIILSIYFHNPSEKLFEFVVKWFIKNGFQFISTDQLCDILENKKEFPASSVIATVDDGWKENKQCIIEVAEKYNIPVTIFVTTKPVETGEAFWWSYAEKGLKKKLTEFTVNELKQFSNKKRLIEINNIKKVLNLNREALTIKELKELSKLNNITFGSHTITHPILTQCSDAISMYELSDSKRILTDWIDKTIKYFAYPNGSYTDREIIYLKKCGYKMSFTTMPDYIRKTIDCVYEIPRFDIIENVSKLENICRATGIWFKKKNKSWI